MWMSYFLRHLARKTSLVEKEDAHPRNPITEEALPELLAGPMAAQVVEVDRQLADVASAGFQHIDNNLLEEIFNCAEFLRLLILRRVCRNWHREISRELAPWNRQVAIAFGSFPLHKMYHYGHVMNQRNFWHYARQAHTVVVFQDPGKPRKFSGGQVMYIWGAYDAQVRSDRRTQLIEKVIYGNTVVCSNDFHCAAMRRDGFEIVVYRSTIALDVGELLTRSDATGGQRDCWFPSGGPPLHMEISNRKRYLLTEEDVSSMKYGGLPNPTAVYFAMIMKTAVAVDVDRLVADFLGTPDKQLYTPWVERLLQQFDPDQLSALDDFLDGDVRTFAAKVNPLVTTLFQYILKQKLVAEWNLPAFLGDGI
ncbi:hypothetical protein RvY_00312 [Ramazzottius varieornatus]|uniref:F-box domain-containing protein n=1 Tax=Ramazzottius varieornatus TaxID=947166 RepID=A0A1D1UJQ8_RAMVA|nr:hypothetical protein RvY_00312 [Ramazzottius varieornatus]